ncbi:MAG: 4Fe-4S ferredoxin, partial [Candidatus Latescibacteria bacterium]|nr:4Fe-4S ferredoxin [Candidatus Latescibacterota bacterium]
VDDLELGKRTLRLRYDICNFCGQCHAYCTTVDGIDYTGEYDLASSDRESMVETVEKELALCEICGGVAGTKDHLTWIADRLGSLVYANPSLVLADMEELSPGVEISRRTSERQINREDIFRILCPDCRRKVYLTEEWGE